MRPFTAYLSLLLAATSLVSSLPVQSTKELYVTSSAFSSFRSYYPCFLCRTESASALSRLFDTTGDIDSDSDSARSERIESFLTHSRSDIVDMETEEEATIRRLAPFRDVDRTVKNSAKEAQQVLRRGAEALRREFTGVMAALTVAGLLADD